MVFGLVLLVFGFIVRLKFSGCGFWFYFVFCLILFLSQVVVVGLAVVKIFRLWLSVLLWLKFSGYGFGVLFFVFLSGCGLWFSLWLKCSGCGLWSCFLYFWSCFFVFIRLLYVVLFPLLCCCMLLCQAVVFGLVLSLFCQAVLFFGLAFLSGCGLCFGLVSV